MSERVFKLHPDVRVELNSQRLDQYATVALNYLSLGPDGPALDTVFNDMMSRCQRGEVAWFEASGAERYFTRNGVELCLRDEYYFFDELSIFDPDLRLSLHHTGTGIRMEIPITQKLLPLFSSVIPDLCVGVGVDADAHSDGDLPQLGRDAARVIHSLVEVGMVTEQARSRSRTTSDPRVTFVAHSMILVETRRARIAVDPLFTLRQSPDHQCREVLDHGLDAIVLSHPHWDHFNFDSLLMVPRATTMVVPRTIRRQSMVNIDMAAMLCELGFSNIITLAPWETCEFADIAVTALPFHGESAGPDAPRDWMTYHIGFADHSLVGVVDACRDEFGTMDSVLLELVERKGSPDILFAPVSEYAYPISCFERRPFYMGPGHQQYSGGPKDAVRWASLLDPGLLVPYALFLFDDEESPTEGTSSVFRHGSIAGVRELLAGSRPDRLCVLRPRDAVAWGEDGTMSVQRHPA